MPERATRMIFIGWATCMCISLWCLSEGLDREFKTTCYCWNSTDLKCSAVYENRLVNVTLDNVQNYGVCYSILPIQDGSKFHTSKIISKLTIFGAISAIVLVGVLVLFFTLA